MSYQCLGQCANIAPQNLRYEQRKTHRGRTEETGTWEQKRGIGRMKGGKNRSRAERVRRTNWAETNLQPLNERLIEAQSNREGAARRRKRRMEKGRRGTSQGTLRPRRTSVSRRSSETGSTPTLANTSTAASAKTRCGRRDGMALQSCHQGAMTRQAGRSGDTSWRRWGESCVG